MKKYFKKIKYWFLTFKYFIGNYKILTISTFIILFINILIINIDKNILFSMRVRYLNVDIPYFDFKLNRFIDNFETISNSLIFLYINIIAGSIYKNYKRIDDYKNYLYEALHELMSYFKRYLDIKYDNLASSNSINKDDFDLYCKITNNDKNNHKFEYIQGSNQLIEKGLIVSVSKNEKLVDPIVNEFSEFKNLRNYLNNILDTIDMLSVIPIDSELKTEIKIIRPIIKDRIDNIVKKDQSEYIYNPNIFMIDKNKRDTYYIKSFNLPNYKLYQLYKEIEKEYLKLPIPIKNNNYSHLGLHKMLFKTKMKNN